MTTLATSAEKWLADEWEKIYSTAVLSGIVGDLAHKLRGGYHISREDQPNDNYSVIRADDKPGNGPSDRAAAIDMTMSTADIIKCHTRLREIWKNRANDPRMKYINAWNGWDGQGDAGRYDVVKGTVTTATSDHKWHIHLEIRRKYVNDMNAMRAILSMLKGETLAQFNGAASPVNNGDDDMTKEEMLALLRSEEGKKAIASAVWTTDDIIAAPGNPKPGKDADGNEVNTHWGAQSYLQNTYAAAVSARTYSAQALNKDYVDENAIAASLANNTAFVDALSAKVASRLPSGVEVSPEQLSEALKVTLREGVA